MSSATPWPSRRPSAGTAGRRRSATSTGQRPTACCDEADCTREEADEIYKLTSLCTFEDRFVIPPMHREQAIEMMKEPHEHREEAGFGFVGGPQEGVLLMAHGPKTLRSLAVSLLTYPDEQTLEAAELLYIILQGELPEAARHMAAVRRLRRAARTVGSRRSIHRHLRRQSRPAPWKSAGICSARSMPAACSWCGCARSCGSTASPESTELPDHITHVLAVIGAMPDDEATRFVARLCSAGGRQDAAALSRQRTARIGTSSPVSRPSLQHVWGEAKR